MQLDVCESVRSRVLVHVPHERDPDSGGPAGNEGRKGLVHGGELGPVFLDP